MLQGLTAGYTSLTVGAASAGALTLLNSPVTLAANTNLTLLSGTTIDTSANTLTLSGTGILTETASGAGCLVPTGEPARATGTRSGSRSR